MTTYEQDVSDIAHALVEVVALRERLRVLTQVLVDVNDAPGSRCNG